MYGTVTDGGDGVAEGDLGEGGVAGEGVATDGGDAIFNRDPPDGRTV